MIKKYFLATLLLASSQMTFAHGTHPFSTQNVPALVNLDILKYLNAPVLYKDEALRVGYAILTPEMQAQVSNQAHQNRACAGFQVIDTTDIKTVAGHFEQLQSMNSKMQSQRFVHSFKTYNYDEQIQQAISQVQENRLKDDVTWMSSYKNRTHTDAQGNQVVTDLENKLRSLLQGTEIPYETEVISHSKTKQKSLRLRLTGKTKPSEIIVLGAHLDSINQSYFGSGKAPGADDNASGSANLLEIVRILSTQPQKERTIEFYWYAGEEGGLLGSSEIAKTYKQLGKNVLSVLQLDMTLFPGEGEMVIGNVKDFTSPRLWDFLEQINNMYLKIKLVDDKCGYGCSDHASWYREGYETLLPFEATTKTMNRKIHTENDVIDNRLSFKHSAVFSQLGLIFAMELSKNDSKVSIP